MGSVCATRRFQRDAPRFATPPAVGASGPTLQPVDAEAELLHSLLDGDEDAFVMLVARYEQPMLRLAESMIFNHAVAEEVVQDTWIGVVRGIDRFEGRSSFKTWLFSILVNRARSAGSHEHSATPIDTLYTVDPLRFDADGHWADPLDAWTEESDNRLDAASLLPALKSALNDLPHVNARSSCCATSRDSRTTRHVPCSGSASGTNASSCTEDVRVFARSSKPRSRRAD